MTKAATHDRPTHIHMSTTLGNGDLVDTMMEIVDRHKEALGDGDYVSMCDALKVLHEVKKLYTVRYWEMSVERECEEDEEDGPMRSYVAIGTKTRIMTAATHGDRAFGWTEAFRTSTLPANMERCPLNSPHPSVDRVLFVSSVEPYLKRRRE